MKSYFKFLSRNKVYAVIEMLGLALAFGFIIILAAYARTEFGAHFCVTVHTLLT